MNRKQRMLASAVLTVCLSLGAVLGFTSATIIAPIIFHLLSGVAAFLFLKYGIEPVYRPGVNFRNWNVVDTFTMTALAVFGYFSLLVIIFHGWQDENDSSQDERS